MEEAGAGVPGGRQVSEPAQLSPRLSFVLGFAVEIINFSGQGNKGEGSGRTCSTTLHGLLPARGLSLLSLPATGAMSAAGWAKAEAGSQRLAV